MQEPNIAPAPLRLENFFLGASEAHGLIEDRWGRVRRRFSASLNGHREGSQFVLEERFLFDDGEEQRRRWQVELLPDGRYRARAGDVVGEAEGLSDGSVVRLRYRLRIRIGSRHLTVTMHDEMFLQPDGGLINRARLSKWGLHLGTVLLTVRRRSEAQQLAAA